MIYKKKRTLAHARAAKECTMYLFTTDLFFDRHALLFEIDLTLPDI